jgi:hypothetical protein
MPAQAQRAGSRSLAHVQSGVKRPAMLSLATILTPGFYAIMKLDAWLYLQPGTLTPSLVLYAGATNVVAYSP